MTSHIRHFYFFSDILGKEMAYTAYLPSVYEYDACRFPILYFLHGRNGDEKFIQNLNIQALADRMIETAVKMTSKARIVVANWYGL